MSATAAVSNTNSSSFEASAAAFRHLATERRSVRSFAATSVPDEVLQDILRLTQRAPTSLNTQPYSVIVLRKQEDRDALSHAMLASNIPKVQAAPVVVVFAADLDPLQERVPQVQKLMEQSGRAAADVEMLPRLVSMVAGESGSAARKAWAFKQSIFPATSLVFAANAHGLGVCTMEGFDELKVREILGLPDRFAVPVVVAMGYPWVPEDGKMLPKSLRLAPQQVFFKGKYGQPCDEKLL